ncbi:MAG: hypothetical protein WEA58_03990 [Balneolaceae bacterium]
MPQHQNRTAAKRSEHYHSVQSESKALIHSGAALLKTALINNNSGADLYVQLFDAAAEPEAGTIPLLSVPLTAVTVGSFKFNQRLSTGIFIALSTEQFSYADADAAGSLNVEFKKLVN